MSGSEMLLLACLLLGLLSPARAQGAAGPTITAQESSLRINADRVFFHLSDQQEIDVGALDSRVVTVTSLVSGLGGGDGAVSRAIAASASSVTASLQGADSALGATLSAADSALSKNVGSLASTLASLVSGLGDGDGAISRAIAASASGVTASLKAADSALEASLSASSSSQAAYCDMRYEKLLAQLVPQPVANVEVRPQFSEFDPVRVTWTQGRGGLGVEGYNVSALSARGNNLTVVVSANTFMVSFDVSKDASAGDALTFNETYSFGVTPFNGGLTGPATTVEHVIQPRFSIQLLSSNLTLEPRATIGTRVWNPPLTQSDNTVYTFSSLPPHVDQTWYVRQPRDLADPGRGTQINVSTPYVATICCATHVVASNSPAFAGNTTGDPSWDRIQGSYSFTSHGGTPCTYFSKVFPPGPYTFRCNASWVSGVFVRPLDVSVEVVPGRGESIVDSHVGMPIWQDNIGSYTLISSSFPPKVLGLPYVRPDRNIGGETGIDITVQETVQAYICCAQHYASGRAFSVMTGSSAVLWDPYDYGRQYPIGNHAGTPCGYFTQVLTAGTYRITCDVTWSTGVFFGPPPTDQ